MTPGEALALCKRLRDRVAPTGGDLWAGRIERENFRNQAPALTPVLAAPRGMIWGWEGPVGPAHLIPDFPLGDGGTETTICGRLLYVTTVAWQVGGYSVPACERCAKEVQGGQRS